jgi:hypothetical protein
MSGSHTTSLPWIDGAAIHCDGSPNSDSSLTWYQAMVKLNGDILCWHVLVVELPGLMLLKH